MESAPAAAPGRYLTSMRRWVGAHPWSFAVLVWVAHLAVLVFVSRALPVWAPDAFPELGAAVVNVAGIAFGVTVVAALGWWRRASLVRLLPRRAAWTLAPLALMPLSYLAFGVHGSAGAWLGGLALYVALGVNEELINRGVILGALRARGRLAAVLGSAVLFGVGHAVGSLFFGRTWFDTGAQILSSVAYGIAVGAVRVRIGTIWPLALFHALDDLVLRQANVPWWWHLVLLFGNLGYGWWLLRGPAPDSVAAFTRPR